MARYGRRQAAAVVVLAAFAVLSSGCASLMASATSRMADDLARAIRNQDDPQTVKDGAPAYLLLTDSLVEGDPNNVRLLLVSARLYSSYATVFVDDPTRAQRLTERARQLSERALCLAKSLGCGEERVAFERYRRALGAMSKDDVPLLYTYGSTLASWIQMRHSDWNAVAEVPYVRVAMERVVALDEAYDYGGAHLYLGFLDTMLPPTLGGKPEQGRAHFERATALSGGRSLMPKVMLAERYARLLYDRPLHDRILKEVLAADPRAPDLTLMNTLAQAQAQSLLASADKYF